MKLMHAVTLLGQFGFTFITPPVVMGLLGWWLQSRFGLGTWIMLICLLLGLMTFAVLPQSHAAGEAKSRSRRTEGKAGGVLQTRLMGGML